MDNKERLTKVGNDILKNLLLTYDDFQIRFFLLILNKAISMHYAKAKDDNKFIDNTDFSGSCIQEIRTDFIRKYGAKKMDLGVCLEDNKENKKTIMGVMQDLRSVCFRFEENDNVITEIPVLSRVSYYKDRKSFIVTINSEISKYLILISENYSILDLNITKDLRGKYEFGIYFIYSMYNTLKQGYKHYTIEEIGKFIGYERKENSRTSDMIKYIEKAIVKINSKIEGTNKKKIKLEKETIGKKIVGVKFIFT